MAKRVFIVDDALFMREMLKKILIKNGYDVVGSASNGIEALEMLKNINTDIVTLDLTMPRMDGLQFLEEINKIGFDYKVVVVSAIAQEYNVRTAISLGASDFIQKPYEIANILSVLERL